MTAAAKLLRLEAEATAGPWHLGDSDDVWSETGDGVLNDAETADARLIVALRSLARPLAEWVEAYNEIGADIEDRLDAAERRLLAAVEAAMATPDA